MEVGYFVQSKAGRDRGRWFIVIDYDEQYAYLCDGGLRRQDKPKKKKRKHVRESGKYDSDIRERLLQQNKVNNSDFRKSIAAFLEQEQPSEI